MASEPMAEVARPPAEGGPFLRWWELAGYGSLLLAAAAMRLWDLGSRAMHHDESLHAFYSWLLSEGSGYQHSPMMHGPFQFEANAGIFVAFGDSDFTARLLYAVAGTLLIGMPLLFRSRLSRGGALLIAGLLASSPTLLYFSRFARNDIIMAVWTLGLVISMWRYIDEGKNRYLYVSSALLALMFATKETSFISTSILGLFLVLTVIPANWRRIRSRIVVGQVSPPAALLRVATSIWSESRKGVDLSKVSRPASFLILLVTLTLPQGAALVSLFQNSVLFRWSNLVLASSDGAAPIGAPVGGGQVIAAVIVFVLLGLSVYWGARWNWSIWWRSALIFYVVWVLLYSTFFSNIGGVASGIWQSLGYWTVQQGEARGAQPWYYYFVISSVYEFLPLLFGVAGGWYYARRKDAFGKFLVYWAVATFILYTIASEKMPWLLVNITLPLIVLSGKFLADILREIRWRELIPNSSGWAGGSGMVLPGVPLLLLLLWRLAFFEPGRSRLSDVLIPLALGGAALIVVALGVNLARRSGLREIAALAAVPTLAILLVLTLRAGWIASYRNGDTPVELLVYTQTTPDVTKLLGEIKAAGAASGLDVPVTIDGTSGFSWPWAWYLRATPVGYPAFDGAPPEQAPDASVLLVHSQNKANMEPLLAEAYEDGERVRHRWWFPEETYRGLTPRKVLSGLFDRGTWRDAVDYFLYRKGVEDRLGSEDAYRYYSKDFQGGS